MVGSEGTVVADIGSIALSGTKTIVIQVPVGCNELFVGVNAKYAAVSATASGIQASFEKSLDGSTYTASAVPNVTTAPAATVMGSVTAKVGISDALRVDAGSVEKYRVTLTNLDGTNAATYALTYLPI